MAANENLTIRCSFTEATFLASLLGANVLLGIQDPFHGWLAEDIEAVWNQARVTLAERHFIEVGQDDQVVMDTAVAALLGTWALPETSIVLTLTAGEGPAQVRYFHLTRYLAVEQSVIEESWCELTALVDVRAVYQRIIQLWDLRDQIAAKGSSVTVPEALLIQARAKAKSDVKAAKRVLREADIEATSASSIAQTLARPIANGALVALARWKTAWETDGLGLLEGRNGLWRLRSFTCDGENWVEATPCDAAQAGEEIRHVVNRALPEPLLLT